MMKFWGSRNIIVGIFSIVIASMLVIPYGVAKIKRQQFLKLPLSGRLVYISKGNVIVYNFLNRTSKTILKSDCFYPRWSPNGERILYKDRKGDSVNINVINYDGTKNRKICKILRTSVCHWLDNENILIIDRLGLIDYLGMHYDKTTLNPFSKNATPRYYYLVIDINNIPEEIVWIAYYGSRSQRVNSLKTKSNTIEYVKKLSVEVPMATTIDGSVSCIKSAYPFFIPQQSNSNFTMVMVMEAVHSYNFLTEKKLIQEVYIIDQNIDALLFMPEGSMWIDPNDGAYPVWSPDASKIAFDDNRWPDGELICICPKTAKSKADIYTLQKRNSDKKGLKGYYLERFNMPRWSPDSRFLVCNHIKPTIIDKLQPVHLHYACEKWIFIYDFVSKRGIDIFKGNDPDWHE